MIKVVIREIIISLLVCIAVLLILSVVFYNFIPANKVVPEVMQYKPAEEIQTQLNEEVDDDSDEIIMTYEITAQDLDNFERIDEYNPGKVNPFAPASEETQGTETEGSSGNGNSGGAVQGTPVDGTSGSNNNSSSGGSSNSGGTLFENGTSK